MSTIDFVNSILLIVSVGGIIVFLFLALDYFSTKKQFSLFFKSFNKNRHNPLDEKTVKLVFDYYHNPLVFMVGSGGVGGGNQRDGDELMENLGRNPRERIRDHQDFNRWDKHGVVIHDLGYTFKKAKNFEKFCIMMVEELPSGSLIIPLNKKVALFHKNEIGVYLSFDYGSVPKI